MKMNHREEKNWQWIKDRLGYVCAVPGCGCTENLELDHIDPRTKKFEVKSRLGCKKIKLYDEVDKCQFLCPDHHKEKTFGEDWEVILEKKYNIVKKFERKFIPLLQEYQNIVEIDISKKKGKEVWDDFVYRSKKSGRSVDEEFEIWLSEAMKKCMEDLEK